MIAIIDNHNSFTYNIVQCVGELGAPLVVFRTDELTAAALEQIRPTGLIISSGPGTPAGADGRAEFIKRLANRVPILGVGPGHHFIAKVYGARLIPAEAPMHGKLSTIDHDGRRLFAGVPSPFVATRYDSVVVDPTSLPDCLEVTATTDAGGEVMGIRHRSLPVEGVQFHPESIFTTRGKRILQNYLAMTGSIRAA